VRIVHLITRLIVGGAQENTILTCEELARLGHEVTLLAGPTCGPAGSLVDRARAGPYRTIVVDSLRRPLHPVRDLAALRTLRELLRDLRPDVVHTHSSKAGILGRRAARQVGAACIVHTIHGLAFDAYQGPAARRVYRAAERRAARWSHRLIAVCRDMADRAAAAGLAPRERIAVVYSGMDAASFREAEGARDEVRRLWGAGPDAFIFLKIARLFHLKGHRFVLPALAEVARRHPEARLVLAGDGILRPDLEAMARRLGVADRVRFLGLLPPEAIPRILWASDAVVHAGLREGLARVLPQAGFCRRPVVTYDVGGAREVVETGVNGYLLPPPGPRAADAEGAAPLAEVMERLAADPVAARKMGERWPKAALAPFDYRAATREILKVYEEVLGK